jgi:hypothetical protein
VITRRIAVAVSLASLFGACSSSHHAATKTTDAEITIVMTSGATSRQTAAVALALAADRNQVARHDFHSSDAQSVTMHIFPQSPPVTTKGPSCCYDRQPEAVVAVLAPVSTLTNSPG